MRFKYIGVFLLAISMKSLQAEPACAVAIDDQKAEMHTHVPTITYGGCIKKRAYPIAAITQEAIDGHHQNLVQELKLNTLARYTVKAATAALVAYLVYELWLARAQRKELPSYASTVDSTSGMQPAVYQNPPDRDEFNKLNDRVTAIGNQFQAHLQENYPQFLTWQWFKNGAKSLGWSVVNIALAKGVFDRMERSIDAIMHEGNLDWFVKTHTRSLETLVELTEYAHSHDAQGASAREHAHHKEQIMQVTNSFITHMTAILGFMSYSKSVTSDPDVRMRIHTLIEYFRITCNEFAQSVTHALEQDTQVTPHISKMSVELNRLLMSFMRLEREQLVG